MNRTITGLLAFFVVVTASGCNAERIVALPGAETHHVDVAMGDLVDITLRAIALGSYISPPAISSPVIVLLSVTDPDKFPVPAGPAQQFRFRAVAPGMAVVTFTPAEPGPTVVDTIVVHQ